MATIWVLFKRKIFDIINTRFMESPSIITENSFFHSHTHKKMIKKKSNEEIPIAL